MHSRVGLHQVAFLDETTPAFIAHCRAIGVANTTLVTPVLFQPGGLQDAQAALAGGGVRVECINHPFASAATLEGAGEAETDALLEAIAAAAALGARSIYMLTGGRGGLSWEAAAERFAGLLAPVLPVARRHGIQLLVENASALNADIHIAHTLSDAIALAELAGIGVCIELHACWFEGRLGPRLKRAMPSTGLVQVSDYVAGDRSTPCRAVPGDGMIPIERLLGDILEAGYAGVFDLELVGPRIAAEGARAASTRAAENLSNILTRLGA